MDSIRPERIKAIKGFQASTHKELYLEGEIFIDASGDSTIARSAGAEFRAGRESSKEFRRISGSRNSRYEYITCSLQFYIRDVGHPVPFTPPLLGL